MTTRDPDDPRAPYQQIASDLRKAIESGKYPPGAQLPTYQELAADWEVAMGTAKSAIAQLRDEGLVVIRHGKGSFVRTHLTAVADQSTDGGEAQLWQAIDEIRERLLELEKRLNTD